MPHLYTKAKHQRNCDGSIENRNQSCRTVVYNEGSRTDNGVIPIFKLDLIRMYNFRQFSL